MYIDKIKMLKIVIVIILLLVVAILLSKAPVASNPGNNDSGGGRGPRPTPILTQTTGQIEHVIFVAFENHGYNAVTSSGPYFKYLAQTYGVVTNFEDLKHAGFCSNTHSLPNYMAITSGTTLWNGQDKCGTDTASWETDNSNNIFNLAASAGLSWGSWAEGFNGSYNPASSSCGSGCIVRHIPTLFYSNNNNLKDYSDWETRYLKGNEVPPNFSFITPNGCDSAHDCKVSVSDNWLANTFNLPVLLQKSWASNTVFIIWFDESESEHTGYLVFVSPNSIGRQHTGVVNTYHLLTTMEWLLGLGNTGNNDNPAIYPPMKDLFGFG